MNITVQGLPGLQAITRQIRETALPSGALGQAVTEATAAYAQGTASRAHRDTGTMVGAQTAEVSGLMGKVYTASATNPRSGQSASTYAPYEEARGGSHAFYNATFQQDTLRIGTGALQRIVERLP